MRIFFTFTMKGIVHKREPTPTLPYSIQQGSKMKLFRNLSMGKNSDSELSNDGHPNINQEVLDCE